MHLQAVPVFTIDPHLHGDQSGRLPHVPKEPTTRQIQIQILTEDTRRMKLGTTLVGILIVHLSKTKSLTRTTNQIPQFRDTGEKPMAMILLAINRLPALATIWMSLLNL